MASEVLAEVTIDPITPKNITPGRILGLWKAGTDEKKESRKRILHCNKLRRGELLPVVNPKWRHKRAAGRHVISVLPERTAIEDDLLNNLAPEPPVVDRHALFGSDSAKEDAEHFEYFLNEWGEQIVDHEAIKGKAIEDAELATLVLPFPLDPLAEPYAVEDDDGNIVDNPFWDRDAKGNTKRDGDTSFTRSEVKSSEAFRDALAQSAQRHSAVSVRLIPALDCAPMLARGMGANLWETEVLVVRTLMTREHAIGKGYSGTWLGGRLLVPHGFGADYAGSGERIYLYEAMIPYRDAKGRLRPFIAYTFGGGGTWYEDGGAPRYPDEKDADKCAVLDLYEEYGIDWVPWEYHFCGMHGASDDPDHVGRPVLYSLANRIHNIEHIETLNMVAMTNQAYAGHLARLDTQHDKSVLLEKDGGLRKLRIPDMGEIETSVHEVTPFPQAEIGADAYRMLDRMGQSFERNRPEDAAEAGTESGHQAMVLDSLFARAHAQIPNGILKVRESILSRGVKVLMKIAERHDLRWPIQTRGERPVGLPMSGPLEFNPRWVGGMIGTSILCRYPETGNLAEQSLAIDKWSKGVIDWEKLQRILGEPDPISVAVKVAAWQQVLGDRLTMDERVAAWRNDQTKLAQLRLVRQQQLTEGVPGAPGIEGGFPEAAIGTEVPGSPGQGGPAQAGTTMPDVAGAVKGSIVGSQMGQATAIADAEAQMQAAPPGAA